MVIIACKERETIKKFKNNWYYNEIEYTFFATAEKCNTNPILQWTIRASPVVSLNFCTVWKMNSDIFLLPTHFFKFDFTDTLSNRLSILFSISLKYYFFILFFNISTFIHNVYCGGQLIPYVQIALERAGPNIQSHMYILH